MKSIKIVNEKGIPFNVRLVQQGDSYGLDGVLTHEGQDPLVEFYDARYGDDDWGGLGQFVSRYYFSTLDDREVNFEGESYGLVLDGGVDSWRVSGDNMDEILGWIDYQLQMK